MFGMDDDEVRRAMRDIFGDDGSGSDGGAASPTVSTPKAEPDFPEIRSGLLSTVPIDQQVPPGGWRPEDWSDGMGATMGSSWPGIGGGGAPALRASAQPGSGPGLPPPNLTPLGGEGPQSAVELAPLLVAQPGLGAAITPQNIASGAERAGADKSKMYGGIAEALGGAETAQDAATAGAKFIGGLGGGNQAALNGLEGTTRYIGAPLAAGQALFDTAKEVQEGVPLGEAALGNAVRAGTVYGTGALLGGGFQGILGSMVMDHYLPSGAVIGHAILTPPKVIPPISYSDPSAWEAF